MVKRSRKKTLPNAWEDTPWISALMPGFRVSISQATREEMESHRNRKGTKCEYYESKILTPSYDMSEESLNYYLYWRDSVRKGKFLRTDMGYLRLLVSELITFNEDPKRTLSLMTRLVKEYRDINIFQIGIIGDACLCFARLNRLPVPHVTILDDPNLIRYQVFEALGSDNIGYLSVHNLMKLFGMYQPGESSDIPLDALYREIITRVDARTRKMTGFGISDSLETVKRVLPVYKGLVYCGDRSNFTVMCPKDLTESPAYAILASALDSMLTECRIDFKKVRIDEDCEMVREIAIGVTRMYLSGELELDRSELGFALDPKKVRESEDDLNTVRELMAVKDEEPVVETENIPVETNGPELTGWEGLSASLDDVMRGYMIAALEGDASRYIKDNKLHMYAVEKGINSLAMDMVGDTIVEGGELVEDYLDEIREMMGA